MTDVAVVTGVHPYDVPAFHAALDSLEAETYPQELVNFAFDACECLEEYDAVIFYHMHSFETLNRIEVPGGARARVESALESVFESDTGVVVLHHALLAFPNWDRWSSLCGVDDRSFDPVSDVHHDCTITVEVAADHPITEGVTDWEMTDETYMMNGPDQVDSTPLLTVDDPRSMEIVAWTREFEESRVCCWQAGHGAPTFANRSFRTVLDRAIEWVTAEA